MPTLPTHFRGHYRIERLALVLRTVLDIGAMSSQGKWMSLTERVSQAIQRYTPHEYTDIPGKSEVRDATAYPLGWIVASAIVAARYHHSAIDAIPVYHPEHGWDRFLLTRRVACTYRESELAESFGQLLLTGNDAPRLVTNTTQLTMGNLLRRDPEHAITSVLDLVPAIGLSEGDHTRCWHERARRYPIFYDVVATLIAEHPGLVAARELFVDERRIAGTYHPLYLHSIVTTPQMVYNWFEVAVADRHAFFRIDGEQAFYQTNNGDWSTVQKQLVNENREGMGRRLLAWLRLDGEPDPESID